MIQLRDYQKDILDSVEESLTFDNKVVIASSGGSGKTILMAQLVKNYTDQKKYSVVLTNMSALIPQLAKALNSFGIKYNIVKAGSHKIEKDAYVTLIMEQSFHSNKREELNIKCDVELKDEGNIGVTGKRYNEIQKYLDPSIIIYFTASPIDEKGYIMEGVTKDQILIDYDVKKLTSMGYLSPLKYYVPKWSEKIDYSNVNSSGNDYNGKELDAIIDTQNHTELILESMNKMNAKNKKTLVYASSIEHAETIYSAMKKDGYKVKVVHSKRTDEDNDTAISLFRGEEVYSEPTLTDQNGGKLDEIEALVSVSSLTIGFDVPSVELIVLCRPTKVYRLYYQIVCRGTRLSKNKKHCEVLDLAQCIANLGFADEPMPLIEKGDKSGLLKDKASREASILGSIVEDEPTEITREQVSLALEHLKAKEKQIPELTMDELVNVFDTTTDIHTIVWIFLEMNKRIRQLPYKNQSISWIAGPWHTMLDDFDMFKGRLIRTMKTRAKNIVRDRKKPASLHYFTDFLRGVDPYKNQMDISEMISDDEIPF